MSHDTTYGHGCVCHALCVVVRSGQQASLRVALHVTKRQTGANESLIVRVTGGISGIVTSHEVLSQESIGSFCKAPSSSPDVDGKAGKERAGEPGGRDAVARASQKCQRETFLARCRRFQLKVARWLAVGLMMALLTGVGGAGMGSIRISGGATVASGGQQASLRVALHVTKRQTGANESLIVRVTGGISGIVTSHEVLSQESIGRFPMRRAGALHPRRKT